MVRIVTLKKMDNCLQIIKKNCGVPKLHAEWTKSKLRTKKYILFIFD